jgi:hypothetical protein
VAHTFINSSSYFVDYSSLGVADATRTLIRKAIETTNHRGASDYARR